MTSILRLLLYLFPPEFRRTYGPEMLELYAMRRGRLRARGAARSQVLGLSLRSCADLVHAALAEWRDILTSPRAVDTTHNQQRISMSDRLSLDARDAIRRLASTPGFTIAGLLILSLGIGANAAIFSAVDAFALRPLPFARPHELVRIYQDSDDGRPSSSAYPAYLDVAAMTHLFSGVGAVMPEGTAMLVAPSGDAEMLHVEFATSTYFPVLGLQPHMGRWFAAAEDQTGAPPAAVIGYDAWQRRFGGDPQIIGRAVRLSGATVTIVGVAPRNYDGFLPGLGNEFWLSISSLGPVGGPYRGQTLTNRQDHWFQIVARLRPERTVADSQSAMNVLAERLAREFPDTDRNRRITVMRADDVRVHPDIDAVMLPAAGVPMVLAGLVLIVACSNLANLLLARGAARRRELGVRLALGATRGQLVRALLTESVLLAAAGGAAGLLLAHWMIAGLSRIELPIPMTSTPTFSIDMRVLAFGFILSVVTGVAFGLWPALLSTRRDVISSLKDAISSAPARRRGSISVRGLLVVQVASSLALLAGGGLLLRSMFVASRIDLGFNRDSLSVMTLDVGQAGRRGAAGAAAIESLRERAAALPGVRAAALATRIPLTPFGPSNSLVLDELAVHAPADRSAEVEFSTVTPNYFEALEIPLRYGRFFTDLDRNGGEPVAIVSEAMARRYWGSPDVSGRRYRHEGNNTWVTIVGVVGDVPVQSPGEVPRPFVYRPAAQRLVNTATLIVRTAGHSGPVLAALRNEVRSFDPLIPMIDVETMDRHVQRSLALPRTAMELLLGFAALAVALACIGVYSVVASNVSRRRTEMSVRMAVGATREQVVRLVVGEMMTLVAAGIVIGLLLAVLLAPALRGLLVGIQPLDLPTFAAVGALLSAVAALSTWLPARRAGRTDLASILRA